MNSKSQVFGIEGKIVEGGDMPVACQRGAFAAHLLEYRQIVPVYRVVATRAVWAKQHPAESMKSE
jgi:hypothetical protein